MSNAAEYLCESVIHAIRRVIMVALAKHAKPDRQLLDVGCWGGDGTADYGRACKARRLFGVEVVEEQAAAAEKMGVTVARCNLEQPHFPWPTASMDIVVCNQVLEHMKNIFPVMDEISRVLKPGGLFVASVPNLASFHSRIMLLLGLQPSMIRVFGPHVRSFTLGEFKLFLTAGGVFRIEEVIGVGFYPLPANRLANFIGHLWPSGSHTPVVILRRTDVEGFSWGQRYSSQHHQTTM